MPARNAKKVVWFLQDVDDMVHLITGKRIHNLVARGLDLFGEDIKKAAHISDESSGDPNDPYTILQVRRTASDTVVKASFRSQAREYHPDTGAHPNPQKLQKITEAFNAIMAERKAQGVPKREE